MNKFKPVTNMDYEFGKHYFLAALVKVSICLQMFTYIVYFQLKIAYCNFLCTPTTMLILGVTYFSPTSRVGIKIQPTV